MFNQIYVFSTVHVAPNVTIIVVHMNITGFNFMFRFCDNSHTNENLMGPSKLTVFD